MTVIYPRVGTDALGNLTVGQMEELKILGL